MRLSILFALLIGCANETPISCTRPTVDHQRFGELQCRGTDVDLSMFFDVCTDGDVICDYDSSVLYCQHLVIQGGGLVNGSRNDFVCDDSGNIHLK